MSGKLVLTVGNCLMGDDAAGPYLAQLLRDLPACGWQFIDGGSAPENCLDQVRSLAPVQVVIVDAADMDLPAGSVRRIPAQSMALPFLITTHTLPLSFLIEALQESVPQVDLVGIQPEMVAFGYPLSLPVRRAAGWISEQLQSPDFQIDNITPYEPVDFY